MELPDSTPTSGPSADAGPVPPQEQFIVDMLVANRQQTTLLEKFLKELREQRKQQQIQDSREGRGPEGVKSEAHVGREGQNSGKGLEREEPGAQKGAADEPEVPNGTEESMARKVETREGAEYVILML